VNPNVIEEESWIHYSATEGKEECVDDDGWVIIVVRQVRDKVHQTHDGPEASESNHMSAEASQHPATFDAGVDEPYSEETLSTVEDYARIDDAQSRGEQDENLSIPM